MRYLTRVILSSLLPRVTVQPRRLKALLAIAGAVIVIVPAVIVLRRLDGSGPAIYDELGLKPLRATDGEGDRWLIEPAAGQPFGRLRESQIAPGLPVIVRADVRREAPDMASVGLTLEGKAGERYSPEIKRNGVRLPAPSFTVINEAGKTLIEGKFAYG